MAGAIDVLHNLESHRLQLEGNIEQLRKAIQHWQTWDAEYEALKEEVDAVPESYDSEAHELHRIHCEYEGELLRGKELDEVFGLNSPRPREQILNILQRRIDYVTRNIKSLQKQADAIETEFSALSQPDATEDDAEPITEIIENLDQDDNFVSYRLNRPADSVPRVREALAKAGLDELPGGEPGVEDVEPLSRDSKSLPSPPPPASERPEPKSAPVPKKAVSFVEDADTSSTSAPVPPAGMSRQAKRVERIMKTAREQESISQQEPIIPKNEDAEDASLRRQMLQYSMGEVGSVVAELHLEEDDTDDAQDFDYGHDDTDDESDQDDDGEDRFGRSTSRMVTDGYRQRMLELEKRLGIKSRFARGADDVDANDDADDECIGRIVIKHGQETQSSASRPPPMKSSIKEGQGDIDAKKGVRFAQVIDVAPDNEPPAAAMDAREEPIVEPLGDVVERSTPASASGPATAPRMPRKTSRFAKARHESASSGDIPKGPLDVLRRFADQAERETPTSGPEGTTLADQIVERDPRPNPTAPGELDDFLDHGAVAGKHQALRKRFIQRQGGFLQEDESPVQLLDGADDASEGVSRFKAARLSRQ